MWFRKKGEYFFQLFKDISGEWRFSLIAPNKEIIATSEGYTTKQNAKKAVKLIMKVAATATVEER